MLQPWVRSGAKLLCCHLLRLSSNKDRFVQLLQLGNRRVTDPHLSRVDSLDQFLNALCGKADCLCLAPGIRLC